MICVYDAMLLGIQIPPNLSRDPSTRIDRRMLLKPACAFYISLGTKLIKQVALSVRMHQAYIYDVNGNRL